MEKRREKLLPERTGQVETRRSVCGEGNNVAVYGRGGRGKVTQGANTPEGQEPMARAGGRELQLRSICLRVNSPTRSEVDDLAGAGRVRRRRAMRDDVAEPELSQRDSSGMGRWREVDTRIGSSVDTGPHFL